MEESYTPALNESSENLGRPPTSEYRTGSVDPLPKRPRTLGGGGRKSGNERENESRNCCREVRRGGREETGRARK